MLKQWLDKTESAMAIIYAISLPLSLTLSWITFICALFVSVLSILVNGKNLRHIVFKLLPKYIFVPMLLFVLAVALSGLKAGLISEALASVFALKTMMVFIWAYFLFARKNNLIFKSLKALLFVSAIAGIFGAIQQVFNFHPFGYKYLQGTGFLGGPMPYAGQMQIFSMLSVGILLCTSRQIKEKIYSIIIALCNLLGVVFAGERSAWLGAISGLLGECILKSKKTALISLILIVFGSGLFYATVPLVKIRTEQLFSPNVDISLQVRCVVWKQAMLDFVKSPALGIGFRNFKHFDMPYAIVPGRSKDINHAHSNYMQIAATTGLFGLITYLWFFIALTFESVFIYNKAKVFQYNNNVQNIPGLALGIFGSIIALMISGVFEYNFGTSQVQLVHWFVLGMLAINTESKIEN
jgi:O-antigen ligase